MFEGVPDEFSRRSIGRNERGTVELDAAIGRYREGPCLPTD
jgi:hypothetical protein